MNCPTCSHTMQHLGIDLSEMLWWCPRCGTLKEAKKAVAPMLVHRAIEFQNTYLRNLDVVMQEKPVTAAIHVQRRWVSLGIAESIAEEDQRWELDVSKKQA